MAKTFILFLLTFLIPFIMTDVSLNEIIMKLTSKSMTEDHKITYLNDKFIEFSTKNKVLKDKVAFLLNQLNSFNSTVDVNLVISIKDKLNVLTNYNKELRNTLSDVIQITKNNDSLSLSNIRREISKQQMLTVSTENECNNLIKSQDSAFNNINNDITEINKNILNTEKSYTNHLIKIRDIGREFDDVINNAQTAGNLQDFKKIDYSSIGGGSIQLYKQNY